MKITYKSRDTSTINNYNAQVSNQKFVESNTWLSGFY